MPVLRPAFGNQGEYVFGTIQDRVHREVKALHHVSTLYGSPPAFPNPLAKRELGLVYDGPLCGELLHSIP